MKTKGYMPNSSTYNDILISQDTELLDLLLSLGIPMRDTYMMDVINTGNLEMLKRLIEHGIYPTKEQVVSSSVKYLNTDMSKYLRSLGY